MLVLETALPHGTSVSHFFSGDAITAHVQQREYRADLQEKSLSRLPARANPVKVRRRAMARPTQGSRNGKRNGRPPMGRMH